MITFDEYPVGTEITTQYQPQGMQPDPGGSNRYFIEEFDGRKCLTAYHSSGLGIPEDLEINFVPPGTTDPDPYPLEPYNRVIFDLGNIVEPHVTYVSVYDGYWDNILHYYQAAAYGWNHFDIIYPGITSMELVVRDYYQTPGFNLYLDNLVFTNEVPPGSPVWGGGAEGAGSGLSGLSGLATTPTFSRMKRR